MYGCCIHLINWEYNFLEGMREHFEKYEIVESTQIKEAEVDLNNEGRSQVKVISLGTAQGHLRKCTNSLINNFATIPTL